MIGFLGPECCSLNCFGHLQPRYLGTQTVRDHKGLVLNWSSSILQLLVFLISGGPVLLAVQLEPDANSMFNVVRAVQQAIFMQDTCTIRNLTSGTQLSAHS